MPKTIATGKNASAVNGTSQKPRPPAKKTTAAKKTAAAKKTTTAKKTKTAKKKAA